MPRAALSFLAPVVAAALVSAVPGFAHFPNSEFAKNFQELRSQDRKVQAVGWRLATSNAPFCAKTTYRTGLQIDDASAYSDPAAIRSANGIAGDIFVQSIVPGSPADEAGLGEGQEIAKIAGSPVSKTPLDVNKPWARAVELRENIAAILSENGSVQLTFANGRRTTVEAQKLCASTFEIITGRSDAVADGKRVAIGRAFKGFAYPEDEFAAALAHELAHNLLGHADWLTENGRKRRNIRETEREADRLMPWLLANAGYDPAAAVRFMRKARPSHGGGIFRSRSHDGWDERAAAIEAEIPRVTASQSRNGQADWKSDFSPQFSRD